MEIKYRISLCRITPLENNGERLETEYFDELYDNIDSVKNYLYKHIDRLENTDNLFEVNVIGDDLLDVWNVKNRDDIDNLTHLEL